MPSPTVLLTEMQDSNPKWLPFGKLARESEFLINCSVDWSQFINNVATRNKIIAVKLWDMGGHESKQARTRSVSSITVVKQILLAIALERNAVAANSVCRFALVASIIIPYDWGLWDQPGKNVFYCINVLWQLDAKCSAGSLPKKKVISSCKNERPSSFCGREMRKNETGNIKFWHNLAPENSVFSRVCRQTVKTQKEFSLAPALFGREK